MQFSKVDSTALSDRFDAKYYDPEFLALMEKAMQHKNSRIKSLGDISRKIKKGIFDIRADEYTDEGVPFIRVSDVKTLSLNIRDMAYITAMRSRKAHATELKPSDLVITKGGTIGTVASIPPWMPLCNVSQDIVAVSLDNSINHWYVAVFLASRLGRIQFDRIKTQHNQPHLTLKPVRELSIITHEDASDDEIGRIFEEAQKLQGNAIEEMKMAIGLVNKAISIELSTSKIRTFSVASSEIGDTFAPIFYYPTYVKTVQNMQAQFETITLDSENALIERGVEVGSKEYKSYLEKQEDDVPFVRTSDIVNYTIDNYPDYYVRKELMTYYKQDLRENDILFANDGKIGASAIIVKGDECIFQSHLRRIRLLNKELTPEFLFAFLNTDYALYQVYRYVNVQSTISTIGHGLSKLKIPLLENNVRFEIEGHVKKVSVLEEERKRLVAKAREKTAELLS